MRDPHRYKPRWGGSVDPKRCAHAVHEGGRGVGFYQCSNKHRPDSEWCSIHEPPTIGPEEPDYIWGVYCGYQDKLEVSRAEIVKETKKQIKVRTGECGLGWRSTIRKNDDGSLELGSRTREGALKRYAENCEQDLKNAEDRLRRARKRLEEAGDLMNKSEDEGDHQI